MGTGLTLSSHVSLSGTGGSCSHVSDSVSSTDSLRSEVSHGSHSLSTHEHDSPVDSVRSQVSGLSTCTAVLHVRCAWACDYPLPTWAVSGLSRGSPIPLSLTPARIAQTLTLARARPLSPAPHRCPRPGGPPSRHITGSLTADTATQAELVKRSLPLYS